ncbi:MAG TPA: hypothetical protein VFI17_13805 [Solirubrobacterales bacterium]|nr:hypothetical protein [Solirubrobacterales bacterium]
MALPAISAAEVGQTGNLRVNFNADLAPRALPRDHPAPVTVSVSGRVSTTDGSHPPPLRRLEIGINRHARISTAGLPVCRPAQLQSTSTSGALERCRGALVGHGSFHTSFDFGPATTIPTSGKVLVFNSRRNGRPDLLMHMFGTTPVRATLILPVAIVHGGSGDFTTTLRTTIPRLAGVGAITALDLELGRQYSYQGVRRSYLSAACAVPKGFSALPFPFLRGYFGFADGHQVRMTLAGNCHVR